MEGTDDFLGSAAEGAGGILVGAGCSDPLVKCGCGRLHDLSVGAVSKHLHGGHAPEASRKPEYGMLIAIGARDANLWLPSDVVAEVVDRRPFQRGATAPAPRTFGCEVPGDVHQVHLTIVAQGADSPRRRTVADHH